ncbi:uncharacterized protein LOC126304714 isoform X3 [Schistocerca gregaria]|uniref:uncharacterized protein LOC126304714 isoform X3 n=1 Tax=Schistocerca gregaria TaxID=7010 RepID=UPI00211EB69F|nr:uncharacterized protein LOC126304714 isoform X3 [Schistocerca gregaria]XP_049847847.1 uncharacterized protein LOC126304714 isoform X3 [Schistocerca gregaria]
MNLSDLVLEYGGLKTRPLPKKVDGNVSQNVKQTKLHKKKEIGQIDYDSLGDFVGKKQRNIVIQSPSNSETDLRSEADIVQFSKLNDVFVFSPTASQMTSEVLPGVVSTASPSLTAVCPEGERGSESLLNTGSTDGLKASVEVTQAEGDIVSSPHESEICGEHSDCHANTHFKQVYGPHFILPSQLPPPDSSHYVFRNTRTGNLEQRGFRGREGKTVSLHEPRELSSVKSRTNPFFCESCEKNFSQADKFQRHLARHVGCGYENCTYRAVPALVKHHEILHERNVLNLETPEEIERYIQERRKRFPKVAKQLALERQAQQSETQDASLEQNCLDSENSVSDEQGDSDLQGRRGDSVCRRTKRGKCSNGAQCSCGQKAEMLETAPRRSKKRAGLLDQKCAPPSRKILESWITPQIEKESKALLQCFEYICQKNFFIR